MKAIILLSYRISFEPVNARYVEVIVEPFDCPEVHSGYGILRGFSRMRLGCIEKKRGDQLVAPIKNIQKPKNYFFINLFVCTTLSDIIRKIYVPGRKLQTSTSIIFEFSSPLHTKEPEIV